MILSCMAQTLPKNQNENRKRKKKICQVSNSKLKESKSSFESMNCISFRMQLNELHSPFTVRKKLDEPETNMLAIRRSLRQQIDLLPVVDSIESELSESFVLPGFGVT